MNLVVHVPYLATDESAGALSLARCAPTFTIEWVKDQRVAVAIFPSLPVEIDLAVQLVGEAVRVPEAWASVNSTPLSSLTKLWQRLVCYRDSLSVADPERYCREQTAHFHALVGCEGHRCPVPCQFVCTPCLNLASDASTAFPEKRFEIAVELAEISWCPRLRVPAPGSVLIHPIRT